MDLNAPSCVQGSRSFDVSSRQAITLVLDSSGTSTQHFSLTSSPIFRLLPTFDLFWTASCRDSTQWFTSGALKNIKIYPYDVCKKCVRRIMSVVLQVYGVGRRVDQLAQVQAELGAPEVCTFRSMCLIAFGTIPCLSNSCYRGTSTTW